MNILPSKRRQPSAPSPIILPDELISEILSWLTVKSLMRLKCVCKSWNSLISDRTFIQMHLNRSARNPHIVLVSINSGLADTRVKSFSVSSILENPSSITLDDDPYYGLKTKDCRWVVGSCNGLFCTLGCSGTPLYRDVWFRFWNPATRKLSEQLGFFREYGYHFPISFKKNLPTSFRFTLGYDNSTNIYKVVALRLDVDGEPQLKTTVRVFNLGDNVWRDIQSFPVVPLRFTHPVLNHGVYLSNSLNWLALSNDHDILSIYYKNKKKGLTVRQFVIISLDLETEMNKQLQLPRGFDVVPDVEPILCVLMDCLCFSHDFKRTHFVIWQLRQFGVEESWTQFVKITYQNPILEPTLPWLPLHLSLNSDILILAIDASQVILYNCRDNRVERTRTTDKTWWYFAKDYVESLVSTC